jgi:hypothetical protein
MRWWLNTDHKTFSFENAIVLGLMDFSSLPANVWMVQWTDGRGEIEYQDDEGNNLNGIRDNFTDIVPYVPFFQQFMNYLAGLTLAQAKKIQSELVTLLFETKSQSPYNHTIAAGNFNWETTDAAVAAMSIAMFPALLSGTNTSLNSLVTQINAQFTSIASQINTGTVNQGDNLATFLNSMIGYWGDGLNTINNKLHTVLLASTDYVAAPGLNPQLDHTTVDFVPVTTTALTADNPGVASIQWIPLGQGTAVTMSVTEMSEIMSGIHNRRLSLTTTKFNKIEAINALTEISDVIAYDVTTGWPS